MKTIADLIERLQKFPQNLEVVLSTDAEGNSFKSLEDVEVYFVEKPDPGTDTIESVFTEEDLADESPEVLEYAFKKVAVFWPM